MDETADGGMYCTCFGFSNLRTSRKALPSDCNTTAISLDDQEFAKHCNKEV